MREIVREAMRAGAVGFATSKSPTHVGYSGKPVPSRKAEMSEITALASVLAEEKSGVIQATVGRELFLNEFADLFRATGRTITWTALLAGMTGSNDGHRRLLAQSLELSEQGMNIVPQVACRPLNFEMTLKEPFIFESLSVFKQISEADFEGKTKIYADPEFPVRCSRPRPESTRRAALPTDGSGAGSRTIRGIRSSRKAISPNSRARAASIRST